MSLKAHYKTNGDSDPDDTIPSLDGQELPSAPEPEPTPAS